jgi:hypothetical protein
MPDLLQVLSDADEEATILESNGASFSVKRVRELLADVRSAAEEWLTWLSETDTAIRSGKSEAWWRARFETMRRDGHARWNGRARQYRACAVPRRANTEAAKQRGRDAARGLRKAS